MGLNIYDCDYFRVLKVSMTAGPKIYDCYLNFFSKV